MRFLCITCRVEKMIRALHTGSSIALPTRVFSVKPVELGLFRALWHRLKGHRVVKKWKTKDFPQWEDYLREK